jgi:ferric iron reductase protein FhuF
VLLASVPDPEPFAVYWQPLLGGPLPLAWTDVGWTGVPDAAAAAEALRAGVLARLVTPLAAVYRDTFHLSGQVVWGNVASGLAGAAQMLSRSGLPLRLDPVAVTAAALEAGPLVGAGAYTRGSFRRHNCCLFYRIPGGGTCGDCILDAPPRSPSPA